MHSKINFDELSEIEEYRAVVDLYEEAKVYLESYEWCKKVINGWYDFGIYEKLGIFLFEIEPIDSNVDLFIWIIIGDLPTVYLDSSVTNGIDALTVYIDLMEDWANAIMNGESIEECYPVEAEPTEVNARLLLSRINFIREEVIPNFEE